MKVLLVTLYPSGEDSYEAYEDIGICYVASYLRNKDYQVNLIGNTLEKIDFNEIVNFKPDIVAVALYDRTKAEIKTFLETVKELLPSTYICLGGCEATFSHELILKEWPFVDFVIRGEGEKTSYELVSSIEHQKPLENVKGLTYRVGQEIVVNNDQEFLDIDTLPFPSRDILVKKGFRFATVTGSRGCTRYCSFCCSPKYWKGWRGRSIENIIDEVEDVYNQYHIDRFMFFDDSLENPNIDRLKSLIKEMVKRRLDIYYIIQIRAEAYKKIDAELLGLMQGTGLVNVYVGVESFNEFDLHKVYNKSASLNDNLNCIEYFRTHDINIFPNFIMFNPYSTFENIKENIRLLKKHKLAFYFRRLTNRYRPYRASTLYSRIIKDGLIDYSRDEFHCFIADARIDKLSNYLTDYFDPFIDKNRDLNTITFFGRENAFILAHLKHYFRKLEKEDELNIVQNTESQINQILFELSDYNVGWFSSLVELAETEWNDRKAHNILENDDNLIYFSDMTRKLIRLKTGMNLKLCRIDPCYAPMLR